MQQDFAHVGGAAFRSNGPHHIGQIFRAELACGFKLLHFRIDLDNPLLAFHLGFACRAWH